MKLDEFDDKVIEKYKSVKDIFIKSKTMICQYITIASSTFLLYGKDIINLFNDNSTQIQALLQPKYFAILSILIGVLTMYFKVRDEKNKLNKGE
jgi:Na+-driven multidrug efflux pump